MAELAEQTVGTMSFHTEGDLLFMRPHSALTEELAHEVMSVIHHHQEQHPRFVLLVDLGEGGYIQPHVRRYMAEQQRLVLPLAIAFFGGNAEVRGINALVRGALRALVGETAPTRHFDTEAEARAWLAEQWQAADLPAAALAAAPAPAPEKEPAP
jgi:hypothetical protein